MPGLNNVTTKSSLWIRIAILLSITFIYIIAFQAFYATTGYIGLALSILPIVAAGWLFGKWAGLLSGILIVPLIVWLFSTVGITEGEKIVNRWPGVFILALTGGMIGWLRDLLGDLKKRSMELLRERETLKEEIDERKRAEEKLRITKFSVDRAVESIYWLGPTGQFLYANDEACRSLGYSRGELLALNFIDIDQGIPRESWEEYWKKIKYHGASTFKTHHRTKDGRILPMESCVNYLKYHDTEYLIALCRDISEQIKSQEHLQQQYERLSALRSIDMIINASLDLKTTFNIFLDQVISQLKVDAADVLMNSHDQKLEYVDGRGFKTSALQHSRLYWGEGHAGRAAQEKRMVMINNFNTSEKIFRKSPLLTQEGFVTYLGQPLIAKGQVVGVLEVFTRFPFEPDQDWLNFFDALTAQAAIAIDNAKLFTDLQKSNLELLQAYDITIEGWSRALDLRDKETEGHSQRVTEMAVQIAQAWENISNNELRYVRWGSLLHDIGKMGIPDSILLKPGPLTEEESEIIQRHPIYAYNLLYPIAFLRPALDIPYCHHEKWDGTGYPRGLKGDQIPLPARIFAVIDTWDALGSDRPYRLAWTEDKIRAYILEQKGKQFDPKVVGVLLNTKMIFDSAFG